MTSGRVVVMRVQHACLCVHVGGAVEARPQKDTKVQECNSKDMYWSSALKVNAGKSLKVTWGSGGVGRGGCDCPQK